MSKFMFKDRNGKQFWIVSPSREGAAGALMASYNLGFRPNPDYLYELRQVNIKIIYYTPEEPSYGDRAEEYSVIVLCSKNKYDFQNRCFTSELEDGFAAAKKLLSEHLGAVICSNYSKAVRAAHIAANDSKNIYWLVDAWTSGYEGTDSIGSIRYLGSES